MPHSLPDIYYQDKQLSSTEIESAPPGERGLWLRVILQLINDTQGKAADVSGEKERQRMQRLAIRWFTENGKDFQQVCLMAGYEPEWIRDKVMVLLKKGGLIEL